MLGWRLFRTKRATRSDEERARTPQSSRGDTRSAASQLRNRENVAASAGTGAKPSEARQVRARVPARSGSRPRSAPSTARGQATRPSPPTKATERLQAVTSTNADSERPIAVPEPEPTLLTSQPAPAPAACAHAPAGLTDEDILLAVAAIAQPPATHPGPGGLARQRRTSSVHSHRSTRSLRSARSGRSGRSRDASISARLRLAADATADTTDTPRRCFVCARHFTSGYCGTCRTTYSSDCALGQLDPLANPLDMSLLFDLAESLDYGLIEAVVSRAFADVSMILATFCRGERPEGVAAPAPLVVDREAVSVMYSVLGSLTSTSPMRAVLKGAETALFTRPHEPLSYSELAYLTILLDCPVFVECSMFTKLMGPMQKLARYSSLRSRARVLLEQSMGLLSNCTDRGVRAEFVKGLEATNPHVFAQQIDLLNSCIGHRLFFNFHHRADGGPSASRLEGRPSHLARDEIMVDWYADDWRVSTFAKALDMYFDANHRSQQLPVAQFANVAVDHADLANDYDLWQSSLTRQRAQRTQRAHHKADIFSDFAPLNRFYFCQYPFLISLMSKARIYKHAARRQLGSSIGAAVVRDQVRMSLQASGVPGAAAMVGAAPGPSPTSVITRTPAAREAEVRGEPQSAPDSSALPDFSNNRSHFTIRVRRAHLVADSMVLRNLSGHDLRKTLRVEFRNEPGVDAGGLRKEWMLLLFRELFAPDLGVFVYDDESPHSWFGSHDLQFYELTGIMLALALLNSVIVDVSLPSLVFKMLMDREFTKEDVREVWPATFRSLESILAYEGDDFAEAFDLAFVAPDGSPLIEDGENVSVTLNNRHAFVEAVLKHLTAATPQIVAFKEGFFRAAWGNAIALFRAEEVELLLKGDRKPIDTAALQQVAKYQHWRKRSARKEPVIEWFWDFFARLNADDQARVLLFITATDRVPATGITSLNLRIVCLGDDSERLPVAHTCFNQLGLYRYATRDKLEKKLYTAITECQGFGIK